MDMVQNHLSNQRKNQRPKLIQDHERLKTCKIGLIHFHIESKTKSHFRARNKDLDLMRVSWKEKMRWIRANIFGILQFLLSKPFVAIIRGSDHLIIIRFLPKGNTLTAKNWRWRYRRHPSPH